LADGRFHACAEFGRGCDDGGMALAAGSDVGMDDRCDARQMRERQTREDTRQEQIPETSRKGLRFATDLEEKSSTADKARWTDALPHICSLCWGHAVGDSEFKRDKTKARETKPRQERQNHGNIAQLLFFFSSPQVHVIVGSEEYLRFKYHYREFGPNQEIRSAATLSTRAKVYLHLLSID
jgi:hypothetical protein